jgi:hypothetical protein
VQLLLLAEITERARSGASALAHPRPCGGPTSLCPNRIVGYTIDERKTAPLTAFWLYDVITCDLVLVGDRLLAFPGGGGIACVDGSWIEREASAGRDHRTQLRMGAPAEDRR